MARWNDEMLDRLADQTQANAEAITRLEAKVDANTEAINRLEAKVDANTEAIRELRSGQAANAEAIRELREGQAMMMQMFIQQQSAIEELRRDTRAIQADVRLILDTLTHNYPNGQQGVN
ncbi:hypothetical protein LQF76_06840 [Gloeomargaritales cyanobacterium VI4D9]|nr:hypothetical protein LQF76_06840 [Gloeomargaritales cyanobacterium VI4D9]